MKIKISLSTTRNESTSVAEKELVDALIGVLANLQAGNFGNLKNSELARIKDIKKLPREVFGDSIGFTFQGHQARLSLERK